jgi:hypothetical protein
VSAVATDRSLDLFLRAYRSRRRDAPLLARVRAIFAQVSPLRLEDDDLESFLSLLYRAVRWYRPRTVVQTGTFVGASALAIAMGLEDNGEGELYTIDPEPPEYFAIREPVEIARRALVVSGLDSRVRLVRGYSTLALDSERMRLPVVPLWRLGAVPPADVLVVDGDHTFDGCLLDLIHGADRLAEDGPHLIVVHDYLGIPEVRGAVRAWLRDRRPKELKIVPTPCGVALIRVRPHDETS